jgi:hypothetical protein
MNKTGSSASGDVLKKSSRHKLLLIEPLSLEAGETSQPRISQTIPFVESSAVSPSQRLAHASWFVRSVYRENHDDSILAAKVSAQISVSSHCVSAKTNQSDEAPKTTVMTREIATPGYRSIISLANQAALNGKAIPSIYTGRSGQVEQLHSTIINNHSDFVSGYEENNSRTTLKDPSGESPKSEVDGRGESGLTTSEEISDKAKASLIGKNGVSISSTLQSSRDLVDGTAESDDFEMGHPSSGLQMQTGKSASALTYPHPSLYRLQSDTSGTALAPILSRLKLPNSLNDQIISCVKSESSLYTTAPIMSDLQVSRGIENVPKADGSNRVSAALDKNSLFDPFRQMDHSRMLSTIRTGSSLRALDASLDSSVQGVSGIRVERVTGGINVLMQAISSSSAAKLTTESQPIQSFLSDNNVSLAQLLIDHGSMGGHSSQSSADRSNDNSGNTHPDTSIGRIGVPSEPEEQGLINLHA